MTRKDFEAIANSVRYGWAILRSDETAEDFAHRVKRNVALNLASELAGTNPRFDRGRFLEACGVDA